MTVAGTTTGKAAGGGSNQHSFATCYLELCRQQRLRPLPMICVTLPHSLDFTTDRVKMDDWMPILNSLSLDRSLRSISVRSKYQHRKLLDDATTESKARAVGKGAPVVLTRFLIEWLSHAVAQCARNSTCLQSLEFEGIPVPADCLAVLCVGLAGSKSLQRLSLQRCHIGEQGIELVCRAVADLRSLRCLDLSHCDLGPGAGPALASALSKQKLALYHDAWKQSLRYREPKLDAMPGLRRLTLNGNAKLGGIAVAGIIDAIRDSLWFKALDLQQCSLSDEVGRDIVELLSHNKSLVVVDVRLNPAVREETLSEINRLLQRNELHAKSDFAWLSLPTQKESSSTLSKRVASAGSLHPGKQQQQQQQQHQSRRQAHEGPGKAPRPKSACTRQQAKRLSPPIVYRKQPQQQQPTRTPTLLPPVTSHIVKRLRPRPNVPPADRGPRKPLKPLERARTPEAEEVSGSSRMQLHLDLQSQLLSLSEPNVSTIAGVDQAIQAEGPLSVAVQVHLDAKEEDDDESTGPDTITRSDDELEELRSQLAEERARREFAEAKLRSAESELLGLRQRGDCVLIEHESMQQLCLSFARLLQTESNPDGELLQRRRPRRPPSPTSDEQRRQEVRRRLALIIRKTKSEQLDSPRANAGPASGLFSGLRLAARLGRSSEGNIRHHSDEPRSEPFRLPEMHIGDTGDTPARLQLVRAPVESPEPMSDRSKPSSPQSATLRHRARAIFDGIVKGHALLELAANRNPRQLT